jgi:hypothetical protein
LRETYDCFTLEQCCGGVLLCKCWDTRKGGSQYDPDYVMCNPMNDEKDYLWCFEPVEIFLGFDASDQSSFAVFVPMTNCLREFAEIAI